MEGRAKGDPARLAVYSTYVCEETSSPASRTWIEALGQRFREDGKNEEVRKCRILAAGIDIGFVPTCKREDARGIDGRGIPAEVDRRGWRKVRGARLPSIGRVCNQTPRVHQHFLEQLRVHFSGFDQASFFKTKRFCRQRRGGFRFAHRNAKRQSVLQDLRGHSTSLSPAFADD